MAQLNCATADGKNSRGLGGSRVADRTACCSKIASSHRRGGRRGTGKARGAVPNEGQGNETLATSHDATRPGRHASNASTRAVAAEKAAAVDSATETACRMHAGNGVGRIGISARLKCRASGDASRKHHSSGAATASLAASAADTPGSALKADFATAG